jgi:hypothetical protein
MKDFAYPFFYLFFFLRLQIRKISKKSHCMNLLPRRFLQHLGPDSRIIETYEAQTPLLLRLFGSYGLFTSLVSHSGTVVLCGLDDCKVYCKSLLKTSKPSCLFFLFLLLFSSIFSSILFSLYFLWLFHNNQPHAQRSGRELIFNAKPVKQTRRK